MIIVVRVGLGLAYQGASSSSTGTPYHRRNNYHDPSSSSAPSSGHQNNRQLSTFKAASHHQEDEGLQSISLGSSSSRTKLDNVKGCSDSSLRVAGDDLYASGTDSRNSGERNGERERETV